MVDSHLYITHMEMKMLHLLTLQCGFLWRVINNGINDIKK